ncbi:hypothetical protein VC83_01176 [Pseudogymnoascus destructans]|uniref:Endosomal peripheral membrane protein n=2 Tax=Pseudogymnoascus destructans TaxID=655981 RepID=L8G947_PSED2|nr:uncharacterized protein VC83_01176 [Pseudogymnoascus destructans]ELR09760.1 hypothetical protein GMDG_04244 [Pseudogymnoascus destructans 20631-21]OAF62342.1 hypothetical protein VC83_01176 [Pseudogymnoascus destructans]
MSLQILSSELSNLIQESKRKHTELRTAAEHSLEELKSLRFTSEAQVAADLSQRVNFVTPFLIACGTKNAKFTGIAVVCLQRLVVSRGLPRFRLKEVLKAFLEATSSGLDVQLKLLQALPSLLQNYGKDIQGELLASVLNICTILQASKNGIVNNTAAATLQQLVVTVFDKVVTEDGVLLEIPTIAEAPVEKGTVQVRASAFDAYRVFNDLCLLTESQKPQFLKVAGLPQTFVLELIESILTNHADVFLEHPEQANVLRTRLMSFIISSMSEKLTFPTTVRVTRILYTLLRRHLRILVLESEMAVGLLTHMLDHDSTLWRRSLCLEVFRGIFADATLTREIFSLYDAQPGKKKILGDLMAAFVRLSSEKPAVVGLGSQSTVPSANPSSNESNDQAMLEAAGIPGIIGGSTGPYEHSAGISVQWSSMRVPCIDQLDKSDPPGIPDSYIYGLALTCINSFAEGLAKFILPLTIPSDSKSRKRGPRGSDAAKDVIEAADNIADATSNKADRGPSHKKGPVPLNPLLLEDHASYSEVKLCAGIVDSCWPAILATCSTFMYACLDAEYFHGLVRSFQKFTHVAGLLRLSTPRDAFLTTLGKAAVPPNIFTGLTGPPSTPTTPGPESHGIFSNARGLLSVDSLASNASSMADRTRHGSADFAPASLNTRNLLCLRALLNLGIALGPTLDDAAWLIILETLQQADFVLFFSSKGTGRPPSSSGFKQESQQSADGSALLANFGTEIKAVETAASRLFESTASFPNDSFVHVVAALCILFGREDEADVTRNSIDKASLSPTASRKASYTHRRVMSTSASVSSQSHGDFFALAKLGNIASINIDRLISFDPEVSGWTILTSELISALTTPAVASPIRQRAAEVVVRIVLEAANVPTSASEDVRGPLQWRLLDTLRRALKPLQEEDRKVSTSVVPTDIEVHRIVLEGLKSILEHCGENLITGWDITFEIIDSVFLHDKNLDSSRPNNTSFLGTRSPRLVRSAFNSLELICSDFLTSLPNSCFLILVDTLYQFCTQDDDFNICLTTVTFFWVVSDFISSRGGSFSLDKDVIDSTDEDQLHKKAKSDDQAVSNAALWLLLLHRLTTVTTDERLELRNSAIHTLLRIFDAYGDHLSPQAWSMCFDSVIFKMLLSIASQLSGANTRRTSETERKAWIETTIVVLNGVANLLATYVNVLVTHEGFPDCWQSLLSHFDTLLKLGHLDINSAVFMALRQILAQTNTESKDSANLSRESTDLVWAQWSRGLPLVSGSEENNQDCLIAYIACLQELYRLMQQYVDTERTQRILDLLREATEQAHIGNYSADIEYLTPLQTNVLESLKLLRTDIKGIPGAIIKQVADFVSLAFQNRDQSAPGKKPTYIALSKESMGLLESLITSHAADPEIYANGAVTRSLTALSMPVALKYGFKTKTKSIAPWRRATSTAIAILEATLPKIADAKISDENLRLIWASIIEIANGIMAADCSTVTDLATINSDQDFDIQSFISLRNLIIPSLGNHLIPDKTRRSFAESLFHTSFIHAASPSELPQINQELLATLYAPRKGRTIDPPPSPRTKMSYVCLDQLVYLLSFTDSSPARVKLAQAAAPFFILRAGVTIRAYVADQPLRGCMPQPLSQRKELLWILKALVDLRCEPDAIPDAPGVESDSKKHLHRLYPFLAQAVRAAGRDQEALEWIGKAFDQVGVEFGL